MTDETISESYDMDAGDAELNEKKPELETVFVFEKIVEEIFKRRGFVIKDYLDFQNSLNKNKLDMLAINESNGYNLTIGIKIRLDDGPADIMAVDFFTQTIKELNLSQGILVSYNGFDKEVYKRRKDPHIDTWDFRDVMNKGRLADHVELSGENISLEVNATYSDVIGLDLLNCDKVHIFNISLNYIPFAICDYFLKTTSSDKYGRTYEVSENSRVIIDPMEFKSLKWDDTSLSSFQRLVLEELEVSNTTTSLAASTNAYSVNMVEPVLGAEKIKITLQRRSRTQLKKYVTYSQNGSTHDEDLEVLIFKPRSKDVQILNIYYIYVPVWEVEFQCNDLIYKREVMASTKKVIRDDISRCETCDEDAVAICDECGRAFCKNHLDKCCDCNSYLCHEHINTCLSCGRHFCDIHAQQECNVAEKYNSLLALRKSPKMTYLRILGTILMLASAGFVIYTVYEVGGDLVYGAITIMFLGGPFSAIFVSAVLFGLVLLTLNYGSSRAKEHGPKGPVLRHRVLKHSNPDVNNTDQN